MNSSYFEHNILNENTITMQSTAHTYAPLGYHRDFLQQFAAKERQRLAKPTPLTVQEHAIHREQLSTAKSLQPYYATETKINLAGILKKWQKYITM